MELTNDWYLLLSAAINRRRADATADDTSVLRG